VRRKVWLILSDATLKALAQRETAGVTAADDQVKLGDGWWDIAQKQVGLAKRQICAHAGTWYGQANPDLSGLAKAKIEKRVNEVEGLANNGLRVVNLLNLVDARRNAVKGVWRMEHGALLSDRSPFCRIEFPYQPPDEYDFRIVFTRTEGTDCVGQICAAPVRQFMWFMSGWSGKWCTFDVVGNHDPNPTRKGPLKWLNNGQEYTSVVRIRKLGVAAYLDGKLVSAWQTDFSDMSLFRDWSLRRNDAIGVGSYESPTIFRTIEVIEVTGVGKTLK